MSSLKTMLSNFEQVRKLIPSFIVLDADSYMTITSFWRQPHRPYHKCWVDFIWR